MTAKGVPVEMEGAGDFKALRAMFQNNSNFSNALLQTQKNPPAEIIPRQRTREISTPISKQHPFRQVKIPNFEQKTESLPCVLPKPELMLHVKPVVLPRVKIRELPATSKNDLPAMNKNKTGQDVPEALAPQTAFGGEPQNQHPKSCPSPQETAVANNSFHQTLNIWKSAFSQNNLKGSMIPPPCANRTACHGQSRSSNVEVTAEAKAKTVESEQPSTLATQNTIGQHSETALPPTTTPPIPPRRPISLQIIESGTPKEASFSSNTHSLDRQRKNVQCSNEIQQNVNEIKLPKMILLPSVVSLGPPPKKPPRPPKVDLSSFQQNLPDAGDDTYLTPESTAVEGQSTYDETISDPKQPESSTHSFSVQETTHSSKSGKKEDFKKQKYLIATPSSEMEAVPKRIMNRTYEVLKQEANDMGKISDHGSMIAKMQMNGESRGGKNMLQEETTQSFPGKRLAKAGNDGYVSLETLKMDEEKADTLELDPRTPQQVPAEEELYDDVEGLVHASDTISSFTSDTIRSFTSDNISDETYEDIESEDYNSTKLDSHKEEKPKKFGKLFKKGKFLMKNTHLKENSRNLSSSAPNLDVLTQESIVYDDIGTEHDDTKEKNEIHKNWMLKFLMSKEKSYRRSSDEAEITPSRNFFKAKKFNLEKNSKEAKEEKWFREKFLYEKKIKVINTAVAHCSNASSKNELDLRITAGEQLEVIDITEGNQVICRNVEGKYGYVLVEHLNFRN